MDGGAPLDRNDGYLNVITGVGTQRDPTQHTWYAPEPILTQQQLESIFEGDGIGRRIVEMPAEEMCRGWFEVIAKEGEGVLDYLETLRMQQTFTDAAVWARLYGGCLVYLILEDGRDESMPVDYKRIRKVVGAQVFDRYSVGFEPDKPSKDPILRLMGRPEFYTLSPLGGGMPLRVHESRIVYVPGRRLDPRRRIANGGWDASVLQGAWTALQRHGSGMGYAANILRDFVQAALAVKDLTSMIAAGREDVVERRIRLLDVSRSILNTIILDAEGEEYTKHTSSVAGLAEILDRFAETLSASVGIPITKLFGKAPGGLNSTGEHDLRNYYDMLSAEQNRMLDPLAEAVVKMVFSAQDGPTKGTEPEDWSVRWRPLDSPTEKETAELRKSVADTDKIYVDAGVLSPEEVAESRFGQGEWSMETQLVSGTDRNPVASMDPEAAAALMNPPAEEEEDRKDWDPNQPRDEKGQWTSGAISAAVGTLKDHPVFPESKVNPIMKSNRWGRDPASALIYKFAKENGPFPEKNLEISSITSDQDNLYVPHLLTIIGSTNTGEAPLVLDRGEKGYRVIDGNHRIVAALLQGKEKVKVQVVDVKSSKLEKFLLASGVDKYELMAIRGDGTVLEPNSRALTDAGEEFWEKRRVRGDWDPNQPRDSDGKWSSEGYRVNPIKLGPYTQDKGNLDAMVASVEKSIAAGTVDKHVKELPVGWLEASQSYLSKEGGGDPVFPDMPEEYWELPVVVKTIADGRYTILDGHHRAALALESGTKKLKVLLFEAKGVSRVRGDVDRSDATPRTLYVCRKLLNTSDVVKWAKAQGIKGLEDDLHATIIYSETPVDWMKMGESWQGELKLAAGGPRLMERFDKGAIVLLFTSSELKWRHEDMIRNGATSNYAEYQPHVTLSYEQQDISNIEPYQGELVFGPELFEEIR